MVLASEPEINGSWLGKTGKRQMEQSDAGFADAHGVTPLNSHPKTHDSKYLFRLMTVQAKLE